MGYTLLTNVHQVLPVPAVAQIADYPLYKKMRILHWEGTFTIDNASEGYQTLYDPVTYPVTEDTVVLAGHGHIYVKQTDEVQEVWAELAVKVPVVGGELELMDLDAILEQHEYNAVTVSTYTMARRNWQQIERTRFDHPLMDGDYIRTRVYFNNENTSTTALVGYEVWLWILEKK